MRRSKIIKDRQEFLSLIPLIQTFPLVHNKLKGDFKELLDMTKLCINGGQKFEVLGRLCIKNFFAMIEADIHYYNLFDRYEGFDEKDRFIDQFKETFKQVAKTFDAETLQKEYFSTKLQTLKKLKLLRNNLMHPKSLEDIFDPTYDDISDVETAFEDYNKFIAGLMSDFFFQYEGDDKLEVYRMLVETTSK
ncbi:hypothetical protein [Mucilaginibacter lacusdianchii]|uniref:hypothetical protein n=1 Tax=Mucilaginibacter lacusdianchii TaxID=2684211 RepID=UPI00131CADDE|nr:hypothetical protein [Mucilaginibacter sp. JXJ CY 39]